MRTTLRLPDELLREAKLHAARTGRTLTALIEDALRQALAREPERSSSMELPTYGGGWVRPGVDIDSTAALLEVMEEAD